MTRPVEGDRRRGKGFAAGIRSTATSTYGLVLLGLLALLIVGIVTVTDYGASIDEDVNARMGSLFLQSYRGGRFLKPTGIEYFNGPFYFMVLTLTSRLFTP